LSSGEATLEFFITHRQFTEAVELAVGGLDGPALGLLLGVAPFSLSPAGFRELRLGCLLDRKACADLPKRNCRLGSSTQGANM
jgi:hypothetical protein